MQSQGDRGPHAVQLACILVKDRLGDVCKVPGVSPLQSSLAPVQLLTGARACARSWWRSCC